MNELQRIEPVDFQPPQLLGQAIAAGANIEVIERLMALQERWQASQAKRAFDNAMATLRTELPPIVKSNSVDFTSNRGRTHYKYEDLHDVTEAITPVMAKHGLSFRWRTEPGEPVKVTCIVSHRDGHSEECALSAPRDESGNKNAIQALGSAITYLQRYTLKAALGVAAARDDDGQSSSQRPEPRQERQEQRPQAKASDVLPKQATEATRDWARKTLVEVFGEAAVLQYLGLAEFSAWTLDRVPTSKQQLCELHSQISQAQQKPEGSVNESELPTEIASVPWPIPPRGVKKSDYKVQTIGELYADRHNKDTAARLFGTMNHFEAKGWEKSDGTRMPPSQADLDLRAGLDALAAWLEEHKQEENQEDGQ